MVNSKSEEEEEEEEKEWEGDGGRVYDLEESFLVLLPIDLSSLLLSFSL